MKQGQTSILTINGGSSSIKFALFQASEALTRRLHGNVDRIGLSGTTLTFSDTTGEQQDKRSLAVPDHRAVDQSTSQFKF